MAMKGIHKVVVMGAGESGAGAALLARKQGMEPFVSDNKGIDVAVKHELKRAGIAYEEGKHSKEQFLNCDIIVKSPGIPDKTSILQEAGRKGVNITGEIDFAARFFNGKIIGITGSNGKTTTTTLLHYILQNAGMDAALGGNIGTSFSRLLLNDKMPELAVLELSSFQLEHLKVFRPYLSAFINFSADHLERYEGNERLYFEAKWNLAKAQKEGDHFIYNYDDTLIRDKVREERMAQHVHPFSINSLLEQGAWIDNESMIIKLSSENKFNMRLEEISLKGRHNYGNTMAASIMARLLEVRKDVIRESLRSFSGLEHRLEPVATVRGIEFINDSKATNVNAVWYALESMQKPVIWIAGGIDKGNDYALLDEAVREKVQGLIVLGINNKALTEAFKEIVPQIQEAGSMHEAVRQAYKLASDGYVVLLSPACSSFDLFENYMDRGQQFKKEVKAL